MIERTEGLSVKEDRKYLEAESASYRKLIDSGYLPQGASNDFKTVCVMKIENEHCNNEKREIYNFNNWQEAAETLCI